MLGMAQKRSAKEWSRLVEQWRRSGRSAKEFAASKGVHPTTLSWWAWRLGSRVKRGAVASAARRTAVARGPVQFLPLQVVTDAVGEGPRNPAVETAVEMDVGGVVIRVRRGFDREVLAAVWELVRGGERC